MLSQCPALSMFLRICRELPGNRNCRGLPYPAGLMMFALFLCLCAGRTSQRSQTTWLIYHWRWILRAWVQSKGEKPKRPGPPSQPTISRLLSAIDPRYLARLMIKYTQESFINEWRDYVNTAKKKQKSRREAKRSLPSRVSRQTYIPAIKLRPQYCLDGKSRGGCISLLTGRTEIDLTVYCPETSQVLGHVTLPDKVGEQRAAPLLIFTLSQSLPSGIFTGDAGITSPNVVNVIRGDGHGYLLAVKGNAGQVYDAIADFDWERVSQQDKFFSEGHGRREIRTMKRVRVEHFSGHQFEKYDDAAVVFAVRSDIHHVKANKFTTETRFFIADRSTANLSNHEAITYIRDHWQQESFHWIKDVVLGEDRCPTKSSNGSRILGLLRTVVVKVGKSLTGSVVKLVEHFSASPESTYKTGL